MQTGRCRVLCGRIAQSVCRVPGRVHTLRAHNVDMGPFNGVCIVMLVLAVSGAQAERWRWPSVESGAGEDAAVAQESVRIDTKVRFVDSDAPERNADVQRDEAVFEPATDTAGFYNRPAGDARFPLHSRGQRADTPHRNGAPESDGTLDALQYCRCEGSPDCSPRSDYNNACGANRYLCCYPRRQPESEFFNEVADERLGRYPGRGDLARPFLPPSYNPAAGALLASGGPASSTGLRPILVGPQGPTGVVGPLDKNNNVDSGESESAQRGVLIGPGRATGIIGPSYNRPILVGPGGPTGIIGPRRQGVLVGPGGPTGIIGRPRTPGVLVGPDGPTGIIGPAGINRPYRGPGVLVGPGGPTGTIGPGRQILVGPGGPTGQIGPRSSYGN